MFFTITSLSIIFLAIIVSQFLIEPELQPIFWMITFLIFICYSNIYMSVYYYIKLRNDPGIQGERGEPGERGSKGSDGVCVINTGCDALQNCGELIESVFRDKIPSYDKIRDHEENGIAISNEDKEVLDKMSNFKEILLYKCNTLPYSREEFKKVIEESLDLE